MAGANVVSPPSPTQTRAGARSQTTITRRWRNDPSAKGVHSLDTQFVVAERAASAFAIRESCPAVRPTYRVGGSKRQIRIKTPARPSVDRLIC
jgi:hypothetical protein